MKKAAINIMSLIIVTTAMAAAASAQASYRAVVPFDFMVGNEKMEAGHYSISQTSLSSDSRVLTIRRLECGKAIMVRTLPSDTSTDGASTLLFDVDATGHYLARMTTPSISGLFRDKNEHRRDGTDRMAAYSKVTVAISK